MKDSLSLQPTVLLLLFSLIKNNNESIFYFSLKSERCRYKQNKQLSFFVKRDTKIANVKVKVHEKRNSCSQNLKITNNTDEKERVEFLTLLLTYTYKLWCNFISMHWLIKCCTPKKKMLQNYMLVRPTEKVSRKRATSGKNESRALHHLLSNGAAVNTQSRSSLTS